MEEETEEGDPSQGGVAEEVEKVEGRVVLLLLVGVVGLLDCGDFLSCEGLFVVEVSDSVQVLK